MRKSANLRCISSPQKRFSASRQLFTQPDCRRRASLPQGVIRAYERFLPKIATKTPGHKKIFCIAHSSRPILFDTGTGPAPAPGAAPIQESRLVTVPLTVGILSPSIILPEAWRLWPAETLSAVLAHEIAHVRRRDPLVSLLVHLNRCIFWFHPLSWWLERKLAATAEQACDDIAVRAAGKARSYAEFLLEMAEAVSRGGGRLSWQGVGVDGTGLLGERIGRILRGEFLRVMSRSRKAAWERARKYAQDILLLAPRFRDGYGYSAAIYMGNIVLGLVTFREGNRQAAVDCMLAASHAPASNSLDPFIPFHTRLTGYLLKYGERASVIEFLERIAQVSPTQKAYLLESAHQIRNGFQPPWYPTEPADQK